VAFSVPAKQEDKSCPFIKRAKINDKKTFRISL